MCRPRLFVSLFLVSFVSSGVLRSQQPSDPPAEPAKVVDATLGETRNVHACGRLLLAGQPTPEDIPLLKERGIRRVITLRTDGEVDWDEPAAVQAAGLDYVAIPLQNPAALTDAVFGQIRRYLQDSETPTLLHCSSANRMGAVWLAHRVLDQGVPLERAVEEAKVIGLRNPEFEARAREYVESQRSEVSVRPGINDNFLAAELDLAEWIGRFEVESREVFAARREIVQATGLRNGMQVADIGAGTGLFTRLFSDAVGSDGWVFAVDIAPRFVQHIQQQAQEDGLKNVTATLCSRNSVNLPPQSVDVVFVCDTYHHFEYPQSTLASIYRALRPDGSLLVVDFERIPGTSREFILNHVRAGKDVFRGEIEAAGFELVEESQLAGLKENYFLRFRKNPASTSPPK